ncbi:phage terminase large subunit [Radicibacter daui]|uniref:phage terminase large subunit n=1 Tax=Radicibacter daui TaxID=3064829 RepID=UPI00404700EE
MRNLEPGAEAGFAAFLWLWQRLEGLGAGLPTLHLVMADWLERAWRDGRRRLMLLAFRGGGKSTIVALFACWLLHRDPELRFLILAADQMLAERMVANMRRILTRHPLTQRLKPRRPEQWAADCFTVERRRGGRDPSALARGIDGNITGSRADIIICDDVEVPRTAATPQRRRVLRERLAELDFILVPDGTLLFVGTPHARESLYADGEPLTRGFDALRLPVLDAAGRSAWPERFSLAHIERLRRKAGPDRFAAQMLLRPVDVEPGRLPAHGLRRHEGELEWREAQGRPQLWLDGRRMISASAWWDPAFGGGQGSAKRDASVVAALFVDGDGGLWLQRVLYLEAGPEVAAGSGDPAIGGDAAGVQCRQVADLMAALHLPSLRIETNGLGRFLPGLLRRELARRRQAGSVLEVASRTAKEARILAAFEAPLAAGLLSAHSSVWAGPFLTELRDWRPGGAGHDDGLDAVAGAIAAEPVRLGCAAALVTESWRPFTSGVKARTVLDEQG